MLYTLAGPTLSLQTLGYTSIALQWTDIGLQQAPIVGYRLYRGAGAQPQSFSLVVALGNVLTYTDSGLSFNTTYTYYVVGIYETGVPTGWSNLLTETTLSLEYLYSLVPSFMDIYDATNPSSIFRTAHLNNNDGGGAANGEYTDGQFLWIQNAGNLYVYDLRSNLLSPTKVATFTNTRQFIVRRGLTSRNNILLKCRSSDYGMESWNVADPTSPTQIDTHAAPPTGGPDYRGFVYDPATNQILNIFSNGFNATYLYGLAVSATGTFGTNWSQIGANIDAIGRAWGAAWMYLGYYWGESGFSPPNVYAMKLDGSGAVGGLGGALPAPGTASWSQIPPRIRGKYLFLGNSNPTANCQAVVIVDMSTWTVITQLGGTSHICDGLALSGHYLVFSASGTMYSYDIAPLLANGSVPSLLQSFTPATTPVGLCGFYSDGWEGNTGACAT